MDRLSKGPRAIFVSGIVLSVLLLNFSYAYTWYAVDRPWWIWARVLLLSALFGLAVYTVFRIRTERTSVLAGGALVTSLLGFCLMLITGSVFCFVSSGGRGTGVVPGLTLSGRTVGVYIWRVFFPAVGIEPPRSQCTIQVDLLGAVFAYVFLTVSLWYDRAVDVIVFRFTELVDHFLALRQ